MTYRFPDEVMADMRRYAIGMTLQPEVEKNPSSIELRRSAELRGLLEDVVADPADIGNMSNYDLDLNVRARLAHAERDFAEKLTRDDNAVFNDLEASVYAGLDDKKKLALYGNLLEEGLGIDENLPGETRQALQSWGNYRGLTKLVESRDADAGRNFLKQTYQIDPDVLPDLDSLRGYNTARSGNDGAVLQALEKLAVKQGEEASTKLLEHGDPIYQTAKGQKIEKVALTLYSLANAPANEDRRAA